MSPSSARWRPRRAGIVNLYEYANQVFDFAGGRLLLRGHNTSGKTKALELLLPFCLDGDISPAKLDPFGSGVQGHEVEPRRLHRRGEARRLRVARVRAAGRATQSNGSPRDRYARATESLPDVKRWYFIARDRTVGDDLALLRGRDPIGKAELAAALGDDGEVLDSQRDYRARLNDLLFGFGGEEQYQTMLRLMRDLRRPHLSKTLDPDRVAAQLTVGLPEIDEDADAPARGRPRAARDARARARAAARRARTRAPLSPAHLQRLRAGGRARARGRAARRRRPRSRAPPSELRTTRDGAASRAAERAERAARRRGARLELERLDAEEHALLGSAAWSSVAEVETLRERAQAQARASAGGARARRRAARRAPARSRPS